MKILNLYAGIGGNRKLWQGHKIIAVELNHRIAAIYSRLYPQDEVIIADAHEYLLRHFAEFDFIWSSPPCQSHTRMNKATRHKLKAYPDMGLYQEVILLREFFKGKWVVENVVAYYEPLVPPSVRIGRHCFWSNFAFSVPDVSRPSNFINRCNVAGKRVMQDWLGIHFDENVYYNGNHCPAQILRNAVHPEIGLGILNAAMGLLVNGNWDELFLTNKHDDCDCSQCLPVTY